LNKKFFSLSDVKETKVLPADIRTNFEAGAFDLSTDFLGDGSGSYFTVGVADYQGSYTYSDTYIGGYSYMNF
jgi:hypothetical protein